MTEPAPVLLYQAAEKIYPRSVHGRYARLRVVAVIALLGLFYLLPWLAFNGEPLVLFDLPHRRFHVFGLTLVPQDLYLLTWLLLIAAMTLFLFTTLFGRVWCGYACPQTVWTEAFLWLERLTEGDRHARMKLDRMGWNTEKLLRRGARHLLWAGFALFTGLSFVAYFMPARELFPAFFGGTLGGWALFWTLFYGFATWGNAGFLREQVCKYMCPYARFQSAMFDKDTLLIAYDAQRGEPRKGLARKARAAQAAIPLAALAPHPTASAADGPPLSPLRGARDIGVPPLAAQVGPGDCVDCTLCVQVCPTGIDIRSGLQYECIACAACVDVCNGVMDSIGKPRGLIRYTSAHQASGQPLRMLRPRAVGYGLLWLLLCAGFVAAVLLRTPLQFDVLRDRHTLYRQLPDGRVENLYTLKIGNTSGQSREYRLAITDAQGRRYEAGIGAIALAAGETRSLTVPVRAPQVPELAIGTLQFELAAIDDPGIARRREARFIAGATP